MRAMATIVTTLLLGLAAGGCAVSEEQEIKMGLQAAPTFEKQFGGVHPDEQLQAYVNRVGMSMVEHTNRPDLPWKFTVLDSKEINAFALPGGPVYITTGLLYKLEDEAQLAGILGHEAGHVAHRHSARQMEKAQMAQGGSALAGVVGGLFGAGGVGDVAQVASGLALMRYGRGQEREADLTGLEYLYREGYDPRGLVEGMQIIKSSSKAGGGAPEFLSTHPDPEDRVEYLRDAVEQKYGNATGRRNRETFERIVLRSAGRDRAGVGSNVERDRDLVRDIGDEPIGRPAR